MRTIKVISYSGICISLVSSLMSSAALSNSPCESPQLAVPCYVKEPKCNYRPAFFKIISGAAFSQKARISANSSFWDPAVEGYNSRLKTGAIIGAGFGYHFYEWLSGDVTLLHQWGFKYNKFQTPLPNLSTPGALPAKTRHFKLASTSVMFDARLHGKGLGLAYTMNCGRDFIAPFLGGGLGFTYHRLSNFYSTIAPTANTRPFPGAASIGFDSATKTSLSYQFEAGVEYKYNHTWGLSAGYRWFDAGKFRGPKAVLLGTGLPGSPLAGVAGPAWKGRLRTHQIFAEISYNF